MIALLDIEGTVCSISFVKDVLYPYFLNAYPSLISSLKFPVQESNDELSQVLSGFPSEALQSLATLNDHINRLVSNDIKDPVLKTFQGKVWKIGYSSGELRAPLYSDAIDYINRSSETYIYSSGSVSAQKLLFSHVDVNGKSADMTDKLSGYFDITTSGYKQDAQSYRNIAKSIGCSVDDIIFYSDNIKEIHAALKAGLNAKLVIRPGNEPLSEEDTENISCITTFEDE